MNSFTLITRQVSKLIPALALLVLPSLVQANSLNPNFYYLVKGEAISRSMSLGDPTDWALKVDGREGTSAGGKISVAPTDFKATGDAIQLTWSPRKKVKGSFALYGSQIDLSNYKDAVSVTIDMRVDVAPNKDVEIGMDCGYPCRATITINKMIRKMPKGEWFSMPIPLNCFKSENFDLSKINAPFTISTEGKFTVSIINVRLENMPADQKGCVDKK